MNTQRHHHFVWHCDKYPALTALFDRWEQERQGLGVTGKFNRWLKDVAESAAEELQKSDGGERL